jgi:hypothetical protein
MIRSLYRCILRAHPRAFRQRFAGEMLWIFDRAGRRLDMLADGIVSLARQWMLRSDQWAADSAPQPAAVPSFASFNDQLPRARVLLPGSLGALCVFVLLAVALSRAPGMRNGGEFFGPSNPGVATVDRPLIGEEPQWKRMLRFLHMPIPADAKVNPLPSTAPAQKLEEWLNVFNQRDPDAPPPNSGAQSTDEVEVWSHWRKQFGKLEVVKTQESAPDRIVVLVKDEKGSWWRMLMTLLAGGKTSVKMESLTLASSTKHIDQIVALFDVHEVIALGEWHGSREDAELRLAVIRHPEFPAKVRRILFECANPLFQTTLDRYVRGGDVPEEQLAQVWRNASTPGGCDSPVYQRFLAAVRSVNQGLTPRQRLRVIAGDASVNWKTIRDGGQWRKLVSQRGARVAGMLKGEKTLLIYGAGHLWRTNPDAISHLAPMFTILRISGPSPRTEQLEERIVDPSRPVFLALKDTPVGRLLASDLLGAGTPAKLFPDGTSAGQVADALIYTGTARDITVRPVPGADGGAAYAAEKERRQKIITASSGSANLPRMRRA